MTTPPENPPAFPIDRPCITGLDVIHRKWDGLTMRDYFAAKAMQSVPPAYFSDLGSVAAYAYQLADFMLIARQKGEK